MLRVASVVARPGLVACPGHLSVRRRFALVFALRCGRGDFAFDDGLGISLCAGEQALDPVQESDGASIGRPYRVLSCSDR